MPGVVVLLLVAAGSLAAADSERGIRLGEETTSKWRFGVSVSAQGSPVTGIRATLPVPMDWPEQSVKTIDEQKSANVNAVTFRVLDGGIKQMIVAVTRLEAGETATATVTFKIVKRRIEAPTDFSPYRIPKSTSTVGKFLAPSPFIESRDAKIRTLAAELANNQPEAWRQAAAIFDWVRANVRYEFAEQIKPATAALKDGVGDCEELSSLFIAVCRANKIPARAVWVPGHTYPEFYLVDDAGAGHWFPCQAAGTDRQFGSMIEDRPILQKGDNFTIPGERAPQRYVKQSLTAKDATAPPTVKFIMERVTE
jgi:hypothetical protein